MDSSDRGAGGQQVESSLLCNDIRLSETIQQVIR
jgi:hypothetical protein